MANFPPTIIVVHPKERRRKCTVNPLRNRDGFIFWNFPAIGPEPLENYVRLGFEGPLFSDDDHQKGLLVLDGTWRLTPVMEKNFAHVPVRSIPPWKTAYPRVSKMFDDPPVGLATIEAIYAAYKLLGRECDFLLDDYHWAQTFLQQNRERA